MRTEFVMLSLSDRKKSCSGNVGTQVILFILHPVSEEEREMKNQLKGDLVTGSITGSMLRFAFPLMLGNLLQQCYNIADTLIVGRVLGAGALAAVGSSYRLLYL